MPAMVVHDVEVPEDKLNEDYPAIEVIYNTDAYEYLLHAHFNSKAVYHPKTMRFLCMDAAGAHWRLTILGKALFMSAAQ